MNYIEVINLLKSNHFYPSPAQKVGSMEIEHLEIQCSPILMDSRIKRIQEVLAEAGATGFKVYSLKPADGGYIVVEKI